MVLNVLLLMLTALLTSKLRLDTYIHTHTNNQTQTELWQCQRTTFDRRYNRKLYKTTGKVFQGKQELADQLALVGTAGCTVRW